MRQLGNRGNGKRTHQTEQQQEACDVKKTGADR